MPTAQKNPSLTPLHNFPLIRSRNVEEIRGNFARICMKRTLKPRGRVEGFDATINACELQHIGFCYAAYGIALELDFPPTGFFCQLFPIRGKGEIVFGRTSVAVSEGASAVISSEMPHKTSISGDYEHLVLRINERALTEKLVALTGATIGEPLRMNVSQNPKHPAAQMLRQYLPLLVGTLSEAVPPFPAWWIAQTEQLLMTLFLCGHRHNYSHLLEPDMPNAALWQVRQAEEYIEANAQRAVSSEELAQVTGVSYFNLFGAFRKLRGYSPLEFLSQVRSKRGEARP